MERKDDWDGLALFRVILGLKRSGKRTMLLLYTTPILNCVLAHELGWVAAGKGNYTNDVNWRCEYKLTDCDL
jgi:hypothetical protein